MSNIKIHHSTDFDPFTDLPEQPQSKTFSKSNSNTLAMQNPISKASFKLTIWPWSHAFCELD